MFFPSNVYPYMLVLAPLVSLALVLVVALIANAIWFGSRIGNALLKVIVFAPLYFALKMAYLMYLAWPAYIKQTATPSVMDFVMKRAAEMGPPVGVSAAILLIVVLIANMIAHSRRGLNVWVTALLFAVAYGAIYYGARTNVAVGMLVETFF
jgi:hypothetical protein